VPAYQHTRFRYNTELLDVPLLLTNLPHSMRFDVLSRMCKSIGCFNVRTHPLFEGLKEGKRVALRSVYASDRHVANGFSGLQAELFLRMQPFYVEAGALSLTRLDGCSA
jgi:hypothetical protein